MIFDDKILSCFKMIKNGCSFTLSKLFISYGYNNNWGHYFYETLRVI